MVEKSKVLEGSLSKNPVITEILHLAPGLKLPNWYLGAGCVAQTVWNELHGFTPTAHIRDYDLVYFDDSDLSYDAEDFHLKEGEKLLQHLGVKVEIKNEARVHLWYHEHFGNSIRPYKSVEDAIASWPTTATSIGVKLNEGKRFVSFAPFGLDDLYGLVIRPNRAQITKAIYMKKVQRWAKLWPNLRVIAWD